jgi:hypothetical protein
MNFETELASVLRQYDVMAERSVRYLTGMLEAHGWARDEMQAELARHRAELAAERRHVAEEFARQTSEWGDGWFDREGSLQ